MMNKKGGALFWIVLIVLGIWVAGYLGYVDLSGVKARAGSLWDSKANLTSLMSSNVSMNVTTTQIVQTTTNTTVPVFGLDDLLREDVGSVTIAMMEAGCELQGGNWTFTDVEVSCSGGHGLNCLEDSNVEQVRLGCNSVDGNFVCNNAYVGCTK